ncbi:putative rRNA maturation factor [Clostridiales Family XIII bacterium PM5-7]
MELYFEEGHIVEKDILSLMEKSAEHCLALEGIEQERTEISISFVSNEEIKDLNREYRGKDQVTDVLSFPQFDDLTLLPKVGEICLGDVVICQEKAMEQAEELGHSFQREIIYLFTHSVLHLLGYDHMNDEDKQEMRQREEEVMEFLGIPRGME